MGLKVRTTFGNERDQTHHNSHMMTSSMLYRTSSSSSSVMGDHIGAESCFDVLSEENDTLFPQHSHVRSLDCRRGKRDRQVRTTREFPPPIPLLARTENLPSHMPWVLKRVYTSDGRLILREEKVRYHEYFRAHRSNGRLTLHLVCLDNGVLDLHFDGVHGDDGDGEINDDGDNNAPADDDDGIVCDNHHCDVHGDHDNGSAVHETHHYLDHYVPERDVHECERGKHDTCDDDDDDQGMVHGTQHHNAHRNYDQKDIIENNGDDDDVSAASCSSLSSMVDQTVVESSVTGGGSSGSPPGKCFNSCFLGFQLPAIRPVLS